MTKRLADLTIDDLERCSVWRVEDEGEVEMAVPVGGEDVPAEPDDLWIVRTRFRLAGGRGMIGYAAPGDWGGIDVVPPVIIHEGQQLALADESGSSTGAWDSLAPSLAQVFPVQADPDATVGGERVSRRYARDGSDPDAKPEESGSFWSGMKDFMGGLGDL